MDFNKKNNLDEYGFFVDTIDFCFNLLNDLKRTNIPYYILVDELEAFFSDEELLKRDLIMVVKMFNDIFACHSTKTSIICAIRSEIINSIDKFIPTKEINKIISSKEISLIWNYSTTSSIKHPIFMIWLRRIEMVDKEFIGEKNAYKLLFDKWFPKEINITLNPESVDVVTFILNNTWNKPRDIVRFISATKFVTAHINSKKYTNEIFKIFLIFIQILV